MKLHAYLVVFVALSLAAPAAAQQYSLRDGHWEISLAARYTGPQDLDGEEGSRLEIEDSLGWGFGFNFNVDRRINLGMGFSWRSAHYRSTIVEEATGNEDVLVSRFDMSTMGVNATWNILETTLTPYVKGSVGWLLVDTNIYAGTRVGCWWHPWWGLVCDRFPTTYGVNTYAADIGVGVRWEPDRNSPVFFKAGYEFGWTGSNLFDDAHIGRIEFGMRM